MRVYLSGPMSGIDGHNYPAFNDAAEYLRKQGHYRIHSHALALFQTALLREPTDQFVVEAWRGEPASPFSRWHMNSPSNYQLALSNNLKELDAILADIDRQIAVHRKSMSEHEQSVDFLLKAKAIIRDHATSIQVELVK